MTPYDFREWRKRLGWTQAHAAAKLDLSVRAIKHNEGATHSISSAVEKLWMRRWASSSGGSQSARPFFLDPVQGANADAEGPGDLDHVTAGGEFDTDSSDDPCPLHQPS
jgi:transcriptional regulator with XRE-family HTH domain